MSAQRTIKSVPAWLAIFAVICCTWLAETSARASTNNLIVNGNFANGLSGWSTFTYGGGYATAEIPGNLAGTTPTTWPTVWPEGAGTNAAGTGPLYDGSLQLTVGAASASAGGFAWQTVAATPGVPYTLTVQGGAQNWWLPTGEIRLWFLDASNSVISSNFVETCLSINNPNAVPPVALYDTGVPYQNWTNTMVSPAGTKFVKVELCNPNGTGSTWFDNAYLTSPLNPPVIANIYPDGTRLLQATNQLAFTATSALPINSSGVTVVLNGVDISSNLIVTGDGTTNVSVTYPGLQTNQTYTATITVTDTGNLISVQNMNFDTYAPAFMWQAVDYDYNSGMFINDPILSSTAVAGSYFGVSGVEGIDFHDYSGDGPESYRPDSMSTSVCGDTPLQNFVTAGVPEYNIGYFDGGGFTSGGNVGLGSYNSSEWVNYTRTFPAGVYNLYARISSGNGPTASVPAEMVISGQGTASQATSSLGNFSFPASGWGTYAYVPLTDQFGNPVKVSLSGTETLKVLAGSGANISFFMLVPPDTNTPTITEVYPDGSTLQQGTNKLAFTVGSASHIIPQTNVVVTLNGVTNNDLTFSGSSTSWNVSLPLAVNTLSYTAVISVTDDVGHTHSLTLYFDTLAPTGYDIEAEDWDFGSGQYIDNPAITSVAASNSYFDQTGTYGVDEYPGDANGGYAPPTADYHFRSSDYVATSICSDTPTRQLLAAQQADPLAFNYNVGWWATNGWLNYTHNYPAGNYHVYGRLAGNTGTTNLIELDQIDATATDYLGTFTEVGRGYNAFDWIPLMNTNNGQMATITLGGVATLRTTTLTGNINPNSYLLVPVNTAPESLQWSYVGGALILTWSNTAFHLQVQTNALGTGLSTGWQNYPGGTSSPVSIPMDQTQGSVFFRLSN